MDQKNIKSLAKKWEFALKDDAEDIQQEILLLFYSRKSNGDNLDIFDAGNEGALFKILEFTRKNRITSVGGSGKKNGGYADDNEPEMLIADAVFCHEEYRDNIEKRLDFENSFSTELDELDNLDYLSGTDLGQAFGFTGSNGRLVLADLKKKIISKAKKRFTSKMGLKNRCQIEVLIQQNTGRA
jgi:hypothetical protein